jgi:hypothetical protein
VLLQNSFCKKSWTVVLQSKVQQNCYHSLWHIYIRTLLIFSNSSNFRPTKVFHAVIHRLFQDEKKRATWSNDLLQKKLKVVINPTPPLPEQQNSQTCYLMIKLRS